MPAITPDQIGSIWKEFERWCEEMRPEWQLTRACNRTKMWAEGRPYGWNEQQVKKKLPVRVEVNRVQPYLEAMVSSMFMRRPRSRVGLPGVFPVKPGRKPKARETGDQVQALLDAWLVRAGVQQAAMDAYSLALMYGDAGFRIGCDDDERDRARRPDVLDRVWVEPIPPWELVMDREAKRGQERYRGHVSLRLLSQVRRELGAAMDDVQGEPLRDFIAGGWRGVSDATVRGLDVYVRLLEFYDLGDDDTPGSQSFWLVGAGGAIRPVGERLEMPWVYPDGCPAVPIVPVVLTHDPEAPLKGIPAVRRIVNLNVEQNLVMSTVLGMARRDAARKVGTARGQLDPDAITALESDDDFSIVIVGQDGADGPARVAEAMVPLATPPIPASLPASLGILERGWQQASGLSDNAMGRNLRTNTSASEARFLAMSDARSASQAQTQMGHAVAALGRLFLTVVREDVNDSKSKALQFVHRGATVRLEAESLALPWEVEIADAGATPVGEEARREEFASIQQPLLTLARLAFGGGGQEPVDPATQIMAGLMLDKMVQDFKLGEEFGKDSLRQKIVEVVEQAQKLAAQQPGEAPMAAEIAGPSPTPPAAVPGPRATPPQFVPPGGV